MNVDPGVERAVDDADALVVVGVAPRAEHHRAEAERADADAGAAEGAVLHRPTVAKRRPPPGRRERGATTGCFPTWALGDARRCGPGRGLGSCAERGRAHGQHHVAGQARRGSGVVGRQVHGGVQRRVTQDRVHRRPRDLRARADRVDVAVEELRLVVGGVAGDEPVHLAVAHEHRAVPGGVAGCGDDRDGSVLRQRVRRRERPDRRPVEGQPDGSKPAGSG